MLTRLHPDQRRLVHAGLFFLAIGVFHLGVWAIDGGPWAGPVTWRKPIVFGLSGGVLSLSLAWAIGHLEPTRGRARWASIFVWAMAVEIGLIVMQRWRGVASHFNDATAFDGLVFSLMGLLAMTFSVPIVVWTRQAFRLRGLPADRALALRAGLALVTGSIVLGVISGMVETSRLKLAHGLALHGLQALPILGGLLRRWLPLPACRARLLAIATAAYVGLIVIALVVGLAG